MPLGRVHLVPGVVSRLRLVFLTVSAVLVGAALLGYLQINKLNQTSDELTLTSLPVFTGAQEIQRNLTQVVLSLRVLERAETIVDMIPHKRALSRKLEVLEAQVDQFADHKHAPEAAHKMSGALSRIKVRTARIIDLKHQVLLLERDIDTVETLLREHQLATRKILEDLAYDVSVQRKPDIDADMPGKDYSRSLRQANAITELTLGVDAFVERALLLRGLSGGQELSRNKKKMQYEARGLSTLISHLTAGPFRLALAQEMLAIRDNVFDDKGVVGLVGELQKLQMEFHSESVIGNEAIESLSQSAENLVGLAGMLVDQATTDLERTANGVIILLMLASLSALAVFLFANVRIVERQINQRMSKLTRAISAIAENKSDHEIGVSGEDELGAMARALEMFKTTNEELKRSNSELEKFAYVAAHDLRSPLRAIHDLAEWTVEDEENILSDASRENMDLLISRVDRLKLLLSDLLRYALVGQETEDLTRLSLPQVVTATRDLLDPHGRFSINYSGTAQDIVTYATPLRQILLNMISNGIKHHDRDSGVIKISGDIHDGRLYLSVEDDGPGIEQCYHDRIFGLFQTLRPRDEVEGSGLGLAIIRKLVEHYGGSIRLISDPTVSRGTRFEFDLPVNPDMPDCQSIAA